MLLCLIGVAGACAGPRSDGGQTQEDTGQAEPMVSDTTIEAAQMELTSRLLPLPGVEGTGIGACEGEPCIKVFLSSRTDDLMRQIPETYRGHRVEVEETGEFRPLPE